MAIGVGDTKATLPAHGADQLDPTNQNQISSYFNWCFCSISLGALIASSVMARVEENHDWTLCFTISATIFSLALCTFVAGFPLYNSDTNVLLEVL